MIILYSCIYGSLYALRACFFLAPYVAVVDKLIECKLNPKSSKSLSYAGDVMDALICDVHLGHLVSADSRTLGLDNYESLYMFNFIQQYYTFRLTARDFYRR